MVFALITVMNNGRNEWTSDATLDRKMQEENEVEDDENECEEEELLETISNLKAENKKLRASLHRSEKLVKESEEIFSEEKEKWEIERKELANLREALYAGKIEEIEEEQTDNEIQYPYKVRKKTVVFGGHDSWLREIKPLFSGNIRFVGRNVDFDLALIRSTDVVWIQPNALSHSQYYRIIDEARQKNKAVRYIAKASVKYGAKQIAENDQII